MQALKKAIEICPASYRQSKEQPVYVAGRVTAMTDFFESVQLVGICNFIVPTDANLTVWRGLSVIGDLPQDIRETPFVKVTQ